MKTIIKVVVVLLLPPFQQLYSQPTISSDLSSLELVCPGTTVKYQVNYPIGLSQCQVTWTIKDGSESFKDRTNVNSNPIFISWTDQNPNKVKMEVVVKYRSSTGTCTSPEETTLTFTHILNSVFG